MIRLRAGMWAAVMGTMEAWDGREGGGARTGRSAGRMGVGAELGSAWACGGRGGGVGGSCDVVWAPSPLNGGAELAAFGGAAYLGCDLGWKNDRMEVCCDMVVVLPFAQKPTLILLKRKKKKEKEKRRPMFSGGCWF